MTGADLVVEFLKAYGVSFITTLSGNGLNPLYLACKRVGLRIIDFRNEQAAAYAADAYARLTGRLSVCAVSSGVAHVNALAGVTNAYFDGAPLLLISGASEHAHSNAGRFQDLDQVALAAPVCKYAKTVDLAERIPFYVQEAIAHALSGRPGPVHLTIPIDVLSQQVSVAEQRGMKSEAAKVQPRATADADLIATAADLLDKARQPLLVAGSGVFYAQAGEALHRFATRMQVPGVVPIWDRGAVENAAPYYLGVIGAASGGPRLLPDADLVIIVGAQVDYRLGYMEVPNIGAETKVIRIDVDPEALHQGVESDLAIHGDPRSVLVALTREVERRQIASCKEWLEKSRRRHREFCRRWEGPLPTTPPMTGRHIIEAVRPLLDDETVFLIDGGNIGQWVHMVLGDRYPSHWLTCGASGVVGWGLPGAIGAKLAYPDRPVVLLSGDGAFGFTTAELEAAVRHGTPFVVIVADDQAWGIVVSGQLRQYGAEGVLGSELGAARYDLVAEGFGALGLRAETPDEVLLAIRWGLDSGRPTVVHVPIARGGPAD